VSAAAGWSFTAARAIGTSHVKQGKPCQDAFRFHELPERNAWVIAVSDGAGSAKHSEHGSAAAVECAATFLARAVDRGKLIDVALLQKAFRLALHALTRVSLRLAVHGKFCRTRDLACTLILAVLNDGRLLTAQVGDGAVVVESGADLRCLSRAQNGGEYVNEATFITSRRAMENIHVTESPAANIVAVAVMTDGVEHLSIRRRDAVPLPGFFQPIFAFARRNSNESGEERAVALEQFLDSDTVNAETDDDKTLVIAVPVIVN
jgi:serine/threonine protein phosphatase PrpC